MVGIIYRIPRIGHEMKHIFLGLCLLMLAFSTFADTDSEVAAAKAAIKEVAGALQTELKSAMRSGGPVAAIAVCHTRAMPITAQVAAEHGMNLSRVSLKNRNPDNAANNWQTTVLEDFEKKRLAGNDTAQLAWTETVNVDGGKEFRFMKAIPTGEVCLGCHGSKLAPEVSTILAELYPQDLATDYGEGDIRGAFVVTRILPNQ